MTDSGNLDDDTLNSYSSISDSEGIVRRFMLD